MKRDRGFDFVRASAILMVLAGHLRHLVVPNYEGGLLKGIPYFFTSFGHFGVIIFFGLSGVLIHKRMNSIVTLKDFISFISIRLFRIYCVLVPALIFTVLIDLSADSLELYEGIEKYAIISQESNPSLRLNLSTLLINLFSFQTFFGPYLGSNGSLWSLSYEVWFYIAGGLFYYKRFLILATIPLVLVQPIWGLYLVFWLVVPYLIRFGHKSLVLFIISTLILGLIHYCRPLYIDVIYMLYFIVNFEYVIKFQGNRLTSYFAKISYSLYVFHYPILLFLVFLLFPGRIKSLAFIDICVILTILFVTIEVLYRLFEGNNFILKIYNKLRVK